MTEYKPGFECKRCGSKYYIFLLQNPIFLQNCTYHVLALTPRYMLMFVQSRAVTNTLGNDYNTYQEYRVANTNIYSRIWISMNKSNTDNLTWHYIVWNYEYLSIWLIEYHCILKIWNITLWNNKTLTRTA